MKSKLKLLLAFNLLFLTLFPFAKNALAQSDQSVIQAVLFFSSTCPHCETVINEDLPPLREKYGNQLQILGINTALPDGQALYQTAIDYYQIPQERRGVPTLIVGEIVLVGSGEIPDQFPSIIESGLANGGILWPNIPNLDTVIAESEFSETGDDNGETTSISTKLSMSERFMLDPAGNTVSVIVLLGMLLIVATVALNFNRPIKEDKFPHWLIPILILIGIGAASYLSFVEISQTEAICGPVGDCNTVQKSPYATLFGFLPVGVLGVIGYILILLAWIIQHYGQENWHDLASKSIWLLSGFGTFFSIYLTFLEPFVIGATCMWCITSAIVQTAIFWITTDPAKKQLQRAKSSKRKRHKRKKKR